MNADLIKSDHVIETDATNKQGNDGTESEPANMSVLSPKPSDKMSLTVDV